MDKRLYDLMEWHYRVQGAPTNATQLFARKKALEKMCEKFSMMEIVYMLNNDFDYYHDLASFLIREAGYKEDNLKKLMRQDMKN